MEVKISNQQTFASGSTFFELTCGKKSAHIIIFSEGIQVCCLNASHKVWKGAGKYYYTIEEALNSYKSEEMQAMILTAFDTKFATI